MSYFFEIAKLPLISIPGRVLAKAPKGKITCLMWPIILDTLNIEGRKMSESMVLAERDLQLSLPWVEKKKSPCMLWVEKKKFMEERKGYRWRKRQWRVSNRALLVTPPPEVSIFAIVEPDHHWGPLGPLQILINISLDAGYMRYNSHFCHFLSQCLIFMFNFKLFVR